ncbi:MAG: hypothetical protein HOO96_33970 [Polyangiaceae bacterium]|nr:hypothetical protein [Polyangiaceae bacterium]
MRTLSSVALSCSLVLAACEGKPQGSGAQASATASIAPSASASAPQPTLDPAVTALAAAALGCKFEGGSFQSCPAADEFRRSTSDALKGEKGDAVVLTMLSHPNERYRVLAASRTLDNASRLFGQKENAEALLTQLEQETNTEVRDNLAAWAGEVDAQRLGLSDRVKALAASKNPKVRRSIGYRFLFHKDTPFGYEIVGGLLGDADRDVRKAAAMGLSNTANFSPSPACKLIADALDGPHGDDVEWSASSLARCPGLQAKVLGFLDKQTQKPAGITNDVGVGYAVSLDALCDDPKARGVKELPSPSAATRKTAFDIAARLASKQVADSNTRLAAFSSLEHCDPVRAKAELAKLAQDADAVIAAEAKTKLAALEKKK